MFEKAVRLKVRFPYKGQVTVEDLWDLSVTALDGIYKSLRAEQKTRDGDSLLSADKASAADVVLALQIDVVKHIVGVKLAEAEDRKKAEERKAQKARIMEIMAQKQDEALKGKSVEELQALLANL